MKSMNVQCIAAAFKISCCPRFISYQRGGLFNGSPKLSMTSVMVEALPQEDPQVAKAAFSIRRTTCRANGIRQFHLEAGAGPPVILLHGFPETSFACRFQIPALAPEMTRMKPAAKAKSQTGYTRDAELPAAGCEYDLVRSNAHAFFDRRT